MPPQPHILKVCTDLCSNNDKCKHRKKECRTNRQPCPQKESNTQIWPLWKLLCISCKITHKQRLNCPTKATQSHLAYLISRAIDDTTVYNSVRSVKHMVFSSYKCKSESQNNRVKWEEVDVKWRKNIWFVGTWFPSLASSLFPRPLPHLGLLLLVEFDAQQKCYFL